MNVTLKLKSENQTVLSAPALCSNNAGASLWTVRFSYLNVSTCQAIYKFHISDCLSSSPLTFRLLPAETQHLLSNKRHHISHKYLVVYKSDNNKLYIIFDNTFSLCTPVLSNNANIRVDKFAKDIYVYQSNYRGADKSLARPGRKQATATEDFDFHVSYL
jgi:hypothetical protein